MLLYIYIYIYIYIQGIIKSTLGHHLTQTKLSTQITLPLMMIQSMVNSAWAEYIGQFLYHLDPDTRKITRLEKS